MNAPAQIIPISPTASSLTHHAVNISELKAQVNLIQYVMRDVMKSGEHYGTVPPPVSWTQDKSHAAFLS